MTYRKPEEITHKGVKLSEALAAHGRWLKGHADGERLVWVGADMSCADMSCANMAHANMAGADMAGANMACANMAHANMAHADMAHADMAGADMAGTIGNMREIKSARFDKWPLTWTTAPDGVVTLQIGCQRHALDLWEKSDPRWIAALDSHATEWWSKYCDVVLSLVKASPAKPYGKVVA